MVIIFILYDVKRALKFRWKTSNLFPLPDHTKLFVPSYPKLGYEVEEYFIFDMV